MEITKTTNVDTMIEEHPWTNAFMIKLGFPCIRCGEAFWGTLEELVGNHKGDINEVVVLLNEERRRVEREGAE